MLAFLVVLSLAVSTGFSIPSGLGACPSPKVQSEFDLEKFAGTWYEIESTAHVDKIAKKCSRFVIEFKSKNKGGLLHKFISIISNKARTEFSDMTTPKSSEPAKMQITPQKGTVLARKWPFWIIETDYDTYAIGYSCSKKLVSFTEDVYILSRTKTLDDKKKMELYSTLSKNDLPQKNLMDIDQEDKDCPTDE